MERKNYEQKILAVKQEICDEIRNILGTNAHHPFRDPFYAHYVEGEVATTEKLIAVNVWMEGDVVFHVINEANEEEIISDARIWNYTAETFMDALERVQKEIREEKIEKIRSLVDHRTMIFSDKEKFIDLEIADNGKIIFRRNFGNVREFGEEDLDNHTLDTVLRQLSDNKFAITAEQQKAIDDLMQAAQRVEDLGAKILFDFVEYRIGFVNTNGKELVFTTDDAPGLVDITPYVVKVGFPDTAYNSEDTGVYVKI